MYSYPSLAERVIQVSSKPLLTTSNQQTGYRGTYREWENISMQKALKEVEEGMPLRRAAERYGVPKSTLHDRPVISRGGGRVGQFSVCKHWVSTYAKASSFISATNHQK